MAPKLLISSGSKKEQLRYSCLSEARASHQHRMWAEVSSPTPHFNKLLTQYQYKQITMQYTTVGVFILYRPVEMWWHTRRNQDFVFRPNGRVHLNRRGASVQSTTGSRGVSISRSNAGYTMFRGSVKSTGYPLHWPVSPPLPHPCVTVCHHISTGV